VNLQGDVYRLVVPAIVILTHYGKSPEASYTRFNDRFDLQQFQNPSVVTIFGNSKYTTYDLDAAKLDRRQNRSEASLESLQFKSCSMNAIL
jgi:hypothetical protein